MRWLWVWLLVSVTVVLGGAWVLFRFLVDLNQLSQLSGVGSLAAGVGALVTAVWTARRPSGTGSAGTASTAAPTNGGTVNTVTGNVSGTLIQAHTIEGGVGDPSRGPATGGHGDTRGSGNEWERRRDG
ncbi:MULTISPECIES: hypothetical protein [Nocardiopsis]|uniref:hypothetical protein n=1 Tax=Nocardiopsis TaxID=2013 RepID=UPI00117E9CDD|nr:MULTISPECIES: hypothetical protein [Nocardiopsis]